MTTISEIENKVYVLTVKHFVDDKGTIRAKTTHGFYVLRNEKLERATNVGITTLSLNASRDELYDDYIAKSGIQPDREFFSRANIIDFKARTDYYETELE